MIPNLITILRLFLVPISVMLIVMREWQAAFFAFMLAGLSDAADGLIARHFDMKTELGEIGRASCRERVSSPV